MVLAGGKSTRLGEDKTLLALGKNTLVANAVTTIGEFCDEVLVVAGTSDKTPGPGARVIYDVYPGKGSLGGIYSGLLAAEHQHCLVVACDMPFLNADLLAYMVSLPRNYDVLIPRVNNHLEPLHAIYSKHCLPYMQNLLDQGHLKILDFFDQVVVQYIDEAEINARDPEHLSFFNVNTPDQLAKARELIKQRELNP